MAKRPSHPNSQANPRPRPSGRVLDSQEAIGPSPPTEDAIARVHALGEQGIFQFFNEVSFDAAQQLVRFLRPVPGFRKTSKAGIQKQTRDLAKRLAAKKSIESPARDLDYLALYKIWRSWASENIDRTGAIDILLDGIEAVGQQTVSSDNEGAQNKQVIALFQTIGNWSFDNKCTREQIERFFLFSPFGENNEIRALIQAAKKSSDLHRDVTLAKNVVHDEGELRSLKEQLKSVSSKLKSLSTEVTDLRRSVISVQSAFGTFSKAAKEMRVLAESQSRTLELLMMETRASDALQQELREQVERLAIQINTLSKHSRGPGSTIPVRVSMHAVVGQLFAFEDRLNASSNHDHGTLKELVDELKSIVELIKEV